MICLGIRDWNVALSHLRTRKRTSAVKHLSDTITIHKSPHELFVLWRDPKVLARIMKTFGNVTSVAPGQLLWEVTTPFGKIESEAHLVDEHPDELVHWQTRPVSDLQVDEYMRFLLAPESGNTEATLTYDIDFSRVPASPMLRAIVSFFDNAPHRAIQKVLQNFKSLAETGEIPHAGKGSSGAG